MIPNYGGGGGRETGNEYPLTLLTINKQSTSQLHTYLSVAPFHSRVGSWP